MKWIELSVFTTQAGLEPVSGAFVSLGIDELQICDGRSAVESFLEDTAAYWDYADLDKLAALIKVYLTNGGKHIQFNVVDDATLRAAQEKPKEYSDLVVRVAGYSTYYTLLTKTVQDELITRTTNEMI